ncbi:flagellar protein FlaG [Clostridium sp.]|uniref:flagellar protein FlaG n=1 Tax=Clostridium sp. TaxID=1506 RepID=UPI00291196BE|nr:flagellar protein FlaG [Clostridium sp.]MBS5982639.1 flagellar protein FlaG [Clostridium butyricum]MDU3580478.1 flagellar protein FlaG [Clostridium butyricum]MDU3594159.1 flagellar protein FlaG [Clostridium butyricum]MDU4586262.1 flagellar protein FlaG [Clostridium sp.]
MNIDLAGSINAINSINSSYYADNALEEFAVSESQSIKGDNEDHLKKEFKENIDKKELDKSLKKLNRFLEDDSVHAEYSVHEDFRTVMIKIIDDTTKEVILEIPPKKILDMVASMCKQFGLIDKKV